MGLTAPDLALGSEGGVLVVRDIHAANYFRVILAARIAGDGTPVWDDTPRIVTPTNPFASRHTPHSFVPDGTLEFETPLRVSIGDDLQASATPTPRRAVLRP